MTDSPATSILPLPEISRKRSPPREEHCLAIMESWPRTDLQYGASTVWADPAE